ncbi:sigma-70 family RNA polymerase sigma factor [Euzebya pacifica]|uniref:sigma-70 family RNA polymerase sigma factor n=1 Tax=Euzebya pacifica TaxID=1608957 RepID=UPI0013DF55A3|nr:sigma-70 family RNA polymerase sigma factor [Euzebya pacifica]
MAEAVLTACEGLVRSRVRRLGSTHADPEDLAQVGRMGVWKALTRFDPDREVAFTTYAVRTIDGELKRHLRDRTWDTHVPRGAKARMVRVGRANAHLREHGEEVTVDALARESGLEVEEVLDGLVAAAARSSDRLDAPIGQHGRSLLDVLPEPTAEDVDLRMDVLDRIAQLPGPQRTAMTLAYYQDLRQHEIAAHLGCSQMQVSRLLKRGRAALAEHLTR